MTGLLREDPTRARSVGQALSSPALLERLIAADAQMEAVRKILDRLGFEEGALYIVGVALLSYMLSKRGEEHWLLAAEYASPPYREALLRFAEESPSLARLRKHRLSRVTLYLRSSESLRRFLKSSVIDIDAFHSKLVEFMGSSADSKTAAFAAKMLLYSCLAGRRSWRGGWSIPMPVDIRVSLVSLTSGMVQGWSCSDDLLALASELRGRWRSRLISLWRLAAEVAGSPPIVLDAAVWVPGGCIEDHLRGNASLESCVKQLAGEDEEHARLLSELWLLLDACEER